LPYNHCSNAYIVYLQLVDGTVKCFLFFIAIMNLTYWNLIYYPCCVALNLLKLSFMLTIIFVSMIRVDIYILGISENLILDGYCMYWIELVLVLLSDHPLEVSLVLVFKQQFLKPTFSLCYLDSLCYWLITFKFLWNFQFFIFHVRWEDVLILNTPIISIQICIWWILAIALHFMDWLNPTWISFWWLDLSIK